MSGDQGESLGTKLRVKRADCTGVSGDHGEIRCTDRIRVSGDHKEVWSGGRITVSGDSCNETWCADCTVVSGDQVEVQPTGQGPPQTRG